MENCVILFKQGYPQNEGKLTGGKGIDREDGIRLEAQSVIFKIYHGRKCLNRLGETILESTQQKWPCEKKKEGI